MEENYFYKVSFYYDDFDRHCKEPDERYFSYNSYDEVREYFEELRDKMKCDIIDIDQVEFGKNGNYIRIARYNVNER